MTYIYIYDLHIYILCRSIMYHNRPTCMYHLFGIMQWCELSRRALVSKPVFEVSVLVLAVYELEVLVSVLTFQVSVLVSALRLHRVSVLAVIRAEVLVLVSVRSRSWGFRSRSWSRSWGKGLGLDLGLEQSLEKKSWNDLMHRFLRLFMQNYTKLKILLYLVLSQHVNVNMFKLYYLIN